MADLEVWLIGTHPELDAAARALAAIGRVLQPGKRVALAGADTGRFRTYARIHVPATTTPPQPRHEPAPGALIDLDAARRQRRTA
uniref:Uncharacterized protein n=1 Tax=Salinispora arenicola (strain CNS-205) TaxID=391037 RepID=A8M696_SALAI